MDGKKNTTSRKINLKNKKMATQALSKNSTKKVSSMKKQVTKSTKNAVKKNTTIDATNKINFTTTATKDSILVEQNNTELKKNKINSTKKKVESNTTDDSTKVTKKKSITEKKATTEKKASSKVKPSPTINKQPQRIKRKPVEEKTKLEIPKEWQAISNKTKELEQDKNIGNKIKHSIFEEIDEKEFKQKKAIEKEQFKKALITILIIVVSILTIWFILIKYNDYVKKQFTVYEIYHTGDKVKLADGSEWYVIKDSKEKEETVKLIFDNVLDINGDGVRNEFDGLAYNTNGKAEYDETNENSIAKYLKETYKKELETRVGKVEEVSLLTSKEYVTIREKMGFGYEWSEGNWLANPSLENWWIISAQNNMAYAINSTGSYRLYDPTLIKFIRPTIVIKKEKISKIEEATTAIDNLIKKVEGLTSADYIIPEPKENIDNSDVLEDLQKYANIDFLQENTNNQESNEQEEYKGKTVIDTVVEFINLLKID